VCLDATFKSSGPRLEEAPVKDHEISYAGDEHNLSTYDWD
jgi:hypothetical protein